MRNRLTDDIVQHMLPTQGTMQRTLMQYDAETVTAAGACALDIEITNLAITDTKAYTLAAPTYFGQKKIVRCQSVSGTPAGTLTVSSPDDTAKFVCPATFFFDTAGQEVQFEATLALKWRCTRVKRAGGLANNVVVGTTAITNKLWRRYSLSVTDGVSSTLPNGAAVGEQIQVVCTAVSGSPVGVLDGTFVGGAGVAYTHLGAIGAVATTTAVGDCALLEWDGAAWTVLFQNGTTLS